jgi:hypothetical protein
MANTLVLDTQDAPVVGWRLGSSDLGVSTWSGAWIASQAISAAQAPTLAFDSLGLPLTAVLSGGSTRLMRLMNRTWSDTTGQTFATALGDQNPALAVDASHSPVVAWLRTSAGTLGLVRWIGTRWDTRPGAFSAGGPLPASTTPQVAVDGKGSMWVIWFEGGLVNVWMSNY